jgi:U3 small nucleolar RNA-associated protein 25
MKEYFEAHNYSFIAICEYDDKPTVDRARHFFAQGEHKYMLYTERVHFFRRYKLMGLTHLVFYQPPVFEETYAELVNQIEQPLNASCLVVYSAYDKMALERVVGSTRCSTMIDGEKEAYMYSF